MLYMHVPGADMIERADGTCAKRLFTVHGAVIHVSHRASCRRVGRARGDL
jgi:hypothetical protein